MPQRVLIDGFQRYDQHPCDGALVAPDTGPLKLIRLTQPVHFDASRPRVVEYMQLQGQLATLLSDKELEVEIERVRATLKVMATLHVMEGDDPDDVRRELRRLIESGPRDAARGGGPEGAGEIQSPAGDP